MVTAMCARNYSPRSDGIVNLYEEAYAGRGRLVFRGTREYFREYAWS